MMRIVLLAGCFIVAALPTAQAADQAKIDEAIRRGAEYLRKASLTAGSDDGGHGLGTAALAGLALLEADVPPSDPSIAHITRIVRDAAYSESKTYQVSLAILYLDRFNKDSRDSIDEPLIQVLGCRLLAGQNSGGGWTYATFEPVAPADAARLRNVSKPAGGGKLHPEADRIYQAVRRGARFSSGGGGDDNSNTQFGIIALWVAQRHGVPCEPAFRLIENRFMRTQSPGDHGWSYTSMASGGGASSPAMTCAGLLGMAVGKANAEAKLTGRKNAPEVEAKPEDDPFYRPPVKGTAKPDDGGSGEEEKLDPVKEEKKILTFRDACIERGLKALGSILAGQRGVADSAGHGGVNDLYFLWSMERVAVAYGLETIGDVDWHKWGCDRILPAQQTDGSWAGSYGPNVSTAFAILFLKKSNLVSDLTRQIDGKVKDPGGGELRGSRGGPGAIAIAPRPIDPSRPQASPSPTGPGLNKVNGPTEADKIADRLAVKQTEAEWMTKLRIAKESKGGQWTAGIVLAIPRLDSKRAVLAREGLADRLTRMNAETLRKMLADRDPELRRAACLACAMKDDKAMILDLINRVTDIDDAVVRAARAGLKSFSSGRDFGPASGSNDDRKRQAYDDWKSWYQTAGP